MPCKMCEEMYVGKPCNKEKLKFKDGFIINFNKYYVKNMFKILRKNCPCTECLVKVVCFKHRLDCDSYLTLLDLTGKKGFISKWTVMGVVLGCWGIERVKVPK